ncbi:MAG: TIGR02757 family protein [Bacteroidales bacterium]|nr:TIGR02757 family protein [Bacteroidales bacterium]
MKMILSDFLEEAYRRHNVPDFIPNDPVSIPHLFSKKEDIEIAGFIAALFAWGQRKTIIRKSKQLLSMMDNAPHDFLISAGEKDFEIFLEFRHRTFNGIDCVTLLQSLQHIYKQRGGLEKVATSGFARGGAYQGIETMAAALLEFPHLKRFQKHIAHPSAGSAAKRINMFLRWMVRRDEAGVDFGLWKDISPARLVCPLDLHSGKVARKLGLLQRPQNDWKAAVELTEALKTFDPDDPVKYDFALFGAGVMKEVI